MTTFDDRINSLTPTLDLQSEYSSTLILNNVEGPTKMIAGFEDKWPEHPPQFDKLKGVFNQFDQATTRSARPSATYQSTTC